MEIVPPSVADRLHQMGLDPNDSKMMAAVEVTARLFRGSLPLPPPEILAEYEAVFPGVTSVLIEWTAAQADHRRGLEAKRVSGEEERMNRGQYIAAGIAFLALTFAGLAALFGNPWASAVLSIVGVGGPTAAIILARNMGPTKKDYHPKPMAPSEHDQEAAGRKN